METVYFFSVVLGGLALCYLLVNLKIATAVMRVFGTTKNILIFLAD